MPGAARARRSPRAEAGRRPARARSRDERDRRHVTEDRGLAAAERLTERQQPAAERREGARRGHQRDRADRLRASQRGLEREEAREGAERRNRRPGGEERLRPVRTPAERDRLDRRVSASVEEPRRKRPRAAEVRKRGGSTGYGESCKQGCQAGGVEVIMACPEGDRQAGEPTC